jgi:hypothetical protein
VARKRARRAPSASNGQELGTAKWSGRTEASRPGLRGVGDVRGAPASPAAGHSPRDGAAPTRCARAPGRSTTTRAFRSSVSLQPRGARGTRATGAPTDTGRGVHFDRRAQRGLAP